MFKRKVLNFTMILTMSSIVSSTNAFEDMSQVERMEAKMTIIDAVGAKAKQAQVMNDMIFSFGELGFQEFETSAYLTKILEDNGFTIERGISGVPTAWMATWGDGGPVIALGSDIDGIPKASQKPGVAYHDPIIEGAPGHGEGHNSGQVVNIIAALTVKEFMEENDISGTIKIWPGVAEEQLGTKAYYVRDGYFKDVDAVLFSHVSNSFSTSWGTGRGNGLVSVQYDFFGESAHSAGSPWRGRSALDAVELMSVGMNYRREHLRLSQRIHSIIVDGGDQPNVVPSKASIWYFFRETDFPHIKELWEIGDKMAEGASLMSNTSWSSTVLGSAWPQHMNKAIAEDAYENIKIVGMPEWSEDDIALAKALQSEIGVEPEGLKTELNELRDPPDPTKLTGGGSDDIGDISWQVPTITLRYPANIPNLPGHNWSNSVAMATPIAHKGVVAGAKVQALNLFDLLTNSTLMDEAWDYYKNVQIKEEKYTPLLRPEDKPAIHLNKEIMATYKSELEKYYYNPKEYDTYLEQLGIDYPTIKKQ
ncbi:peptidase dimerization domain-containing protein [Paraglaciecola sp. 2405UD69-4]|uniref:peptidase dimerization domain-containing protein n=1 Tax=Paraglaciecola sp. 2405UD69-4 TaxID=3391836 RepID=UPI0039C976B1